MGTLRNLHPDPNFIKSLVEEKSFENDPLVVVDVGARKGFEKHWDHYGDQISLIGFEPNVFQNPSLHRHLQQLKGHFQTIFLLQDSL
jgi:hypothetical protein